MVLVASKGFSYSDKHAFTYSYQMYACNLFMSVCRYVCSVLMPKTCTLNKVSRIFMDVYAYSCTDIICVNKIMCICVNSLIYTFKFHAASITC